MRYLTVAFLLLVGCTPATSIWLHPDGSTSRTIAAQNRCEKQALQTFPEHTVTSEASIAVKVASQFCSGPFCVAASTPGLTPKETRDANLGPRQQFFASCMAQAGFQQSTVPACRAGQGLAPVVNVRSLDATDKVCTRPDGIYQIISGG